MGRSEVVDRDRRLRLANSSPDVKALFNAPSYIYDLEDPMPEPTIEYWTPMPPIVCNITFGPTALFNILHATRAQESRIVQGTQKMPSNEVLILF